MAHATSIGEVERVALRGSRATLPWPAARGSPVFGVDIGASSARERDPVAAALRAERLGFDFVSVNDHVHGHEPRLETWTLVTWVARATSHIRVLTRVLAVPYRSPVVLAKMAETLDRLSGGRLVLGLGAGASEAEFEAFDLGVRTPRQRIDALAEAVQVIRGIWYRSPFWFQGSWYSAHGAEVEPKPLRPIPIWLGTFGPRALRVTGELADGWIPSLGHATHDQLRPMRERMLRAAIEAGRDLSRVSSICNLEFRVQPGLASRPDAAVGSAADVAERLLGLARLGFDGFNFQPLGDDRDDQLEQLTERVLPFLRSNWPERDGRHPNDGSTEVVARGGPDE